MEKVNGQTVNAVLLTKDKKLNELTVNISVDPFKEMGVFVRLTHKDIILYLQNEKKLNIGDCIQSSVISNTSDESLFGTWIFKLPDLDNKNKVEVPLELLSSTEELNKTKKKHAKKED